jgi:hypothetical protein
MAGRQRDDLIGMSKKNTVAARTAGWGSREAGLAGDRFDYG